MMRDTMSVLEADLDYAARMVMKGFGTLEQAAQACGVRLSDLQERVARETLNYPVGQEKRS